MELIKDYDFTLEYHPGKANVVAYTLGQKLQGIVASLLITKWKALETLSEYDIQIFKIVKDHTLICLVGQPTLVSRIIEAQKEDDEFQR